MLQIGDILIFTNVDLFFENKVKYKLPCSNKMRLIFLENYLQCSINIKFLHPFEIFSNILKMQ